MNHTDSDTGITPQEVVREKSLGGAISLCARAAGYEPKQVQDALHLDKAQWSRWESGTEGIVWSKFTALMDHCGNDAPLLWMLHRRGYDLHSLRRKETEVERLLREAHERIAQLSLEKRVLTEILQLGDRHESADLTGHAGTRATALSPNS